MMLKAILGLAAEYYFDHESLPDASDMAVDASWAFGSVIELYDWSLEDMLVLYRELAEAVPEPGCLHETSGTESYIDLLKSALSLEDDSPIIKLVIDEINTRAVAPLDPDPDYYRENLAARKHMLALDAEDLR